MLSWPNFVNYYDFNSSTGYPSSYYYRDTHVMAVVKLMVPINILAAKSYLASTVILSYLSYVPLWTFYKSISRQSPELKDKFKYILFIPSLCFWGSGVLKDTFTTMFIIIVVNAIRKFLYKENHYKVLTVSLLAFAIVGIVNIKPYLFIGLLPSSLIWISWNSFQKIKNTIVRLLVVPILMFGAIGFGFYIWSFSSQYLGTYSSVDSIIQKAHVSYNDLKQDYYQGNSFDLGDYEASISGVVSKFPQATITGLFRPFLWESKNIVMLLSGLENTILLVLFVYILFKSKKKLYQTLNQNPFLIFCIFFSVLMAFSIAISTTNFGALVRFKIPILPFMVYVLIAIAFKKKGASQASF